MFCRLEDTHWEFYDPFDPYRRGPWDCPLCGIDNRKDRTDCRICMCPRDNFCRKCRKVNEDIARYCRFCGGKTEYNLYKVFDPAERKEAAKSSRAVDRKYKKLGHYFQWEDGPYQGLEDEY